MAKVDHSNVDYYNCVDGINTVSSALRLKPSEARNAQNMDLFPIGGFSKRNGYTALNSTAVGTSACTGLYMARYFLNGGTNIAYMFSGAALYSMSAALGGTWADATNSLTITAGNNNIWNMAILNDIVVAGNGNTDASLQISSAGVATALSGGGLPFTKFLFPVESRGYMWYFQPTVSTVQYDRGYFSSVNDPATVGSTSFVDVAKGQGGDVRGAVDYKGALFVFKRHGIYQINYQPTRVNSSGTLFPWTESPNPVVPGVGTQSHRSIVKFTTPSTHATPGQELVFFVDQFGIPRIFDGATTISFSSKIGSSRDTTITSLASMDMSRNSYCFAVNYPTKNRILCFMSQTGSQQDTCWVLDYTTGFSFMRYKFYHPFNCGTLFEKSDGTFKPYFGDYAGKVYQGDSGTSDDSHPIEDYYITGDAFLKSPSYESKWFFIDVRGSNGSTSQNTKISTYVDGNDTIAKTDTFSLADSQTLWGSSQPMTWGISSWSKQGMIQRASEVNMTSKTLRIKIETVDKLNDRLVMEGMSLTADVLGTSQS